MNPTSEQRWWRATLVAVVIWAVLLTVVQLAKHYSLQTGGRDLGLFDHPLSNTLRGQFLESSFLPATALNYFAFHFCPIILIFLPFYALHDGAEVLLIGQALFMAASAIPLFLLVRRLTRGSWAFLTVLIYLLYRPLTRAASCGFHQETLFPLFVLSAAYAFFVVRRRLWSWFWVVLALSTKEDVSIYFIPVALLMLFRREYRKDAVGLLILCVTYFVAVNKLVVPAVSIGGSTEWPSHFRGYGSTPLEIALTAARHPFRFLGDVFDAETLPVVASLLGSLGLVPLLSWFSLPAAVPALANFLSTLPVERKLGIYYAATVFPYLFLGFAWGMKRISGWLPEPRRTTWITGLLVLLVIGNALNSSFVKWAKPSHWRNLCWVAEAQPVLDQVPPGISLEIQNCLFSHLRPQDRAYGVFPEKPEAEYVLLFEGADPWPLTREEFARQVAALRQTPGLQVVAEHGRCQLLRRPRVSGP